MKTRILLIVGMFLLTYCYAGSEETSTGSGSTGKATITVKSSPDLYHLTTMWASEFCRLNPTVNINVINTGEKSPSSKPGPENGLGVLTDESYAAISKQSTWNMVLGHDVIVPVMNSQNPLLQEIYLKGITREGLARTFEAREKQNWGVLLGNGKDLPAHFYIPDDPSIKSGVARYINTNKFIVDGIVVANGPAMIAAIQKDQNSFGFCRLIDVIDADGQTLAANIKLVPIDKNGNGRLDYMEDIYDNLKDFTRGVWIGKYPKALSGNIHLVSNGKPTNEAELAFLRWILTDGQQYLNMNGFSDLATSEKQAQLDKLRDSSIYITAGENDHYAILKIVLLAVFAFLMTGFAIDIIGRRLRSRQNKLHPVKTGSPAIFDENSIVIPKGIYFDKSHTWAFMEKDGLVKVGIDDFIQHVTGPLTRIEMKNVGEKIKKGDLMFTLVQKGKQLNIHAPVSGTIMAQNRPLATDSSALNATPYSEGWVYLIEPANWQREIQFLSMADKYRSWLKDEFLRLKDFFATAVKSSEPEYAHVVLQDGGAIRDSILFDLGPEVWEDFQTKFIDTAR